MHVFIIVVFAVMDSTANGQLCTTDTAGGHEIQMRQMLGEIGHVLLDGDNTSCIEPFVKCKSIIRLGAGVFVPYHPAYRLKNNIYGIDLNCDDPAMVIYFGIKPVSAEIIMQQCNLYKDSTAQSCSFCCVSNYPLNRQTQVFVQIEKMPWEQFEKIPGHKICEINTNEFIADP